MNIKGINYDIGTKTTTGRLTRETFDLSIVAKEIEIIKNDLHCNAIRISGLDTERIAVAAEIALKLGLTVWFSPSMHYDTQENTLKYVMQACRAAEKLRSVYSNVIFVLGCEFTLFTAGFVRGNTGNERLKNLFSPVSLVKNLIGMRRSYNKRLNIFLSRAVENVRQEFHGQITYASGTWEKPGWEIFDLIGVDFYRSSYNKLTFLKELQAYKKMGKPVYIMEFGCCTYKGAEDKGAMGWAIADWKKGIPELKGNFTRDEQVQAKYLAELLEIFNAEGIPGAFVFTFVMYNYLHDNDPRYDMDMASYGIVKVMPGKKGGYHQNLPWVPKQAFYDLADYYSNH